MTVSVRKFLVLRTTDADDFLIVGGLFSTNETEAFAEAKKLGLITRRGSFLVVLDESNLPPDRQTYRVNGFGRLVWIVSKETPVECKPGSGPRREAA